MSKIQDNIQWVWWATAFAMANAVWFFIAHLSGAPIIENELGTLDMYFFTLIGLTCAGFLAGVAATFVHSKQNRRRLVNAWYGYLLIGGIALVLVFSYSPEIAII